MLPNDEIPADLLKREYRLKNLVQLANWDALEEEFAEWLEEAREVLETSKDIQLIFQAQGRIEAFKNLLNFKQTVLERVRNLEDFGNAITE